MERVSVRLGLIARYVVLSLPMFAVWEVAQLPLYTIWVEEGAPASFRAALHCTAGDAACVLLAFGCAWVVAVYVPRMRSAVAIATMTLLIGLAVAAAVEVASTRWLGSR